MNRENAIEVREIKKRFKIYFDKGNSLKEKILFKKRNRYEDRWVLKGISFDVKKGEAIGLVGKNGCGKSTTLKMLTKIMFPDSGTIDICGRVSSLIELGAGFHPDMSGRENIYTNAAIFGLKRKEIDRRIDEIIRFSELEDFIDNPVRTYSSGMYMRLAFSVAINVNADVLLIDEILGVGDVNFQTKCFERLKEIKSKGTTIVIVSHSLDQIEQICDKSYWIENGVIREEGKPKYVHEKYLSTMEEERIERIKDDDAINKENRKKTVVQQETKNDKDKDDTKKDKVELLPEFCSEMAIRMGNRKVEIIDFALLDENNNVTRVFKCGDTIRAKVKYKVKGNETIPCNFGFGIYRDDLVHCYGTNVLIENGKCIEVSSEGELIIDICNTLLQNKYFFDIAIHSEQGDLFDDIRKVASFQITSSKRDIGICRLESKWKN